MILGRMPLLPAVAISFSFSFNIAFLYSFDYFMALADFWY